MALAAKIPRLLEVTNHDKHQLAMIEAMGEDFGNVVPDDPALSAKIKNKFREFMKKEIGFARALVIDFYKNNFSESEIDELIEMNSRPVLKRLQELAPSQMAKTMDHFKVCGERFAVELEKMLTEEETTGGPLAGLSTLENGEFKPIDTSLKRMCEVAKSRLNDPKHILRLIYVDQDAVPTPIRSVIVDLVDGKIDRREAAKRLDAIIQS